MILNKIIVYFSAQFKWVFFSLIKPSIVIIEGVRIPVGLLSASKELLGYFYRGYYERDEVDKLKKVLEKKDNILEVGAGIGFLSAFIAGKIGDDRVIAVEANPTMMPLIKKTHQINSVSPLVLNCVLAESGGYKYDFYIEKDFWSSSIVQRSNSADKVSVDSVSVNELIKEYSVNFLIIDIEGGEKDLFEILDCSEINKILIELHPGVIGDKAVSNIIRNILSKGFSLDSRLSSACVYYFYK